jgi:hypothetical protein
VTKATSKTKAPRANLRGRVLALQEDRRNTRGASQAEHHEGKGRCQQSEADQQDDPGRGAGRLTGEEQRQQNDRAELGKHGPGDDKLAKIRGAFARIVEQRHHHAERRCYQDDGNEERSSHLPCCKKGRADQ